MLKRKKQKQECWKSDVQRKRNSFKNKDDYAIWRDKKEIRAKKRRTDEFCSGTNDQNQWRLRSIAAWLELKQSKYWIPVRTDCYQHTVTSIGIRVRKSSTKQCFKCDLIRPAEEIKTGKMSTEGITLQEPGDREEVEKRAQLANQKSKYE